MAVSCSSSNEEESQFIKNYDYLPVKLKGSDMWSIIRVKTGEVVLKDEFENCPSKVCDDVFFVENKKGTFDYYNVNDPNTPLNNTSYYMASDYAPIMPVVKPGKGISLINDKFEEIATLDKSIRECGRFVDGYTWFTDASGKTGFMDSEGNIVVKAQYDAMESCEYGIAVCVKTGIDKNTFYVIDMKGNELYSFDTNKYDGCGFYRDGYLSVIRDKKVIYLDEKGKKAFDVCELEASDPQLLYEFRLYHGTTPFFDSGKYGLMDKDGNIKVRAKYDFLSYTGDGLYTFAKDIDESKFGLVDKDGNIVLEDKYDRIDRLQTDVFLVLNGDTYTLVNEKGEEIGNESFSNYAFVPTFFVKSNDNNPQTYVDMFLKYFNDHECCGVSYGLKLKDFTRFLSQADAQSYTTLGLIVAEGQDLCYLFDAPLSNETPSGYLFNKENRVVGVKVSYDISDIDCIEKEVGEKFDKELVERGYKLLDNGLYQSPKGTMLTLNYEYGELQLWYFFTKDHYIGPKRIERKEKTRMIPDGMPSNGVYDPSENEYEEAVDSVADYVDEI